jgi:hypothetical protein
MLLTWFADACSKVCQARHGLQQIMEAARGESIDKTVRLAAAATIRSLTVTLFRCPFIVERTLAIDHNESVVEVIQSIVTIKRRGQHLDG